MNKRAETSSWQADMRRRLLPLGQEDLLEIGRKNNDRVHGLLPPHIHSGGELEIIYVDKGVRNYIVGGQKYEAHGGEVLVVRPGDTHQTAWPFFPTRLYWIKLRLPRGGHAFLNLRGKPAKALVAALRRIRPQHFLGSPAIKPLLDRIIALYLQKPSAPATPAILCILILEFLLIVIDCAAKRKDRHATDSWTQKIISFVEDHLHSPIHVKDMAEHMTMSLPGFKLRFDRQFGVAPAKYVAYRKISVAKDLLAGKLHMPVTRIAIDLGFASSQHFATVFHRICGDTPGSYRRKSISSAKS
ncbi:MAG: hypothetical protein C0404_10125 [Verrucomicrobia bacterium]|nr:hypothetical protein [Verrucomicrobiota bacterium]